MQTNLVGDGDAREGSVTLFEGFGYDMIHSKLSQRVFKVLESPVQALKPQGLCASHINFCL